MWLKDDDRNTKLFHEKAEQRRRTNHISKLRDENGSWWRGRKNCERILIHYFSDFFPLKDILISKILVKW